MPLHQKSPWSPQVSQTQRLWRYTSLAKFLSLIQKGEIFFSRSDLLGDPFEGAYPELDASEKETYKTIPGAIYPESKQILYQRQILRLVTYINCWNMDTSDSYLMWKSYTSSSESICIQSNLQRLLKCLDSQAAFDVMVSTVTYLDYERDNIPPGNVLSPFVHKRNYYQQENEIRALIWKENDEWRYPTEMLDPSLFPSGLSVPINPDDLIESIYLHPNCTKWQEEVVQEIVARYSLTSRIIKSSISGNPIF